MIDEYIRALGICHYQCYTQSLTSCRHRAITAEANKGKFQSINEVDSQAM